MGAGFALERLVGGQLHPRYLREIDDGDQPLTVSQVAQELQLMELDFLKDLLLLGVEDLLLFGPVE